MLSNREPYSDKEQRTCTDNRDCRYSVNSESVKIYKLLFTSSAILKLLHGIRRGDYIITIYSAHNNTMMLVIQVIM